MSEAEWGESWDDWEAEADNFTFGPNGEFMDMSTMPVGWWEPLDWAEGEPNGQQPNNESDYDSDRATPPPPIAPPVKETTPQPKDMINEYYFVRRIIRHFRYIALLDAVKHHLNLCFENPPSGYESNYFFEEMKKWKEFCDIADRMRGVMPISQQDGKVGCRNKITGDWEYIGANEFAEQFKIHEDQLARDIVSFGQHYTEFFKDASPTFQSSHDYVLEAVGPELPLLVPYEKNAFRYFPRGGGNPTYLTFKDRIRDKPHVRKYLDKFCDLAKYGYDVTRDQRC